MGAKAVVYPGSPIPIPRFVFANGKNRPLITLAGLELVKHFEGCYLEAYLDSVKVPTIAFGRIVHPNGRKVRLGDRCTIQEAYAWLFEDLEREGAKYVAAFTLQPWLLADNQWSALVSFTYNRGAGRFNEKLDDLVDEGLRDGFFNQKELEKVAETMRTYDYAGRPPRVLLGLKRRRYAEKAMFLGQDWEKFVKPGWQKHLVKAEFKRFLGVA